MFCSLFSCRGTKRDVVPILGTMSPLMGLSDSLVSLGLIGCKTAYAEPNGQVAISGNFEFINGSDFRCERENRAGQLDPF